MEYIQNVGSAMPNSAGGKSTKNIAVVIVLLVVVLAVAGFAYWKFSIDSITIQPQTQTPPVGNIVVSQNSVADDTSSVIDAELNAMGEVGTIDGQFSDIDQARQGL